MFKKLNKLSFKNFIGYVTSLKRKISYSACDLVSNTVREKIENKQINSHKPLKNNIT